jgi:hypothetical protein
MDDLRYFALLNNEKKVINISTFPKNPDPITILNWNGEYIWIYDGNSWNSLNENESSNFRADADEKDFNYIDNITGNAQDYLNAEFPNSSENTIVINSENLPDEISVFPTPEEHILHNYDETYTIVEYSLDNSITNNVGIVEYFYDEYLNAFIDEDAKVDDTYIFNFDTSSWEPDLNIDYDLYGDGVMYKWDGETWNISS